MSPDTGPIGSPLSSAGSATEFPARAPQRLAVSFEFSPPRTDAAEQTLWETVKRLTPLHPSFFSVTYGAGGSTRQRTHDTVARLKSETGIDAAAHLTCVAATQGEIDDIARAEWDAGIRHIVALRGDPPGGMGGQYTPHPGGYANAAELVEGLKKHCPGMIIQLSTGGRSGNGRERGGMLPLAPDMASLSTGSCNFPTRVYENSPELVDWLAAEMIANNVKPEIEAFDLSMIFQAVKMEQDGRIKGPLHVQFVMGVKNAMPVDKETFDYYVKTLKRLAPNATWTGAGIGKGQLMLNRWSLEAGGHCRTGLEDNIRWDESGKLAPSNAALVKRVADLCAEYGRRPATTAEARKLLSLAAA